MTTNAHDVLDAARSLSPQQQLEVLQGLAHSLAQSLNLASPSSQMDTANATFWRGATLDELSLEQHTPIFTDATDLRRFAIADWPPDETTDELLTFVHRQREVDAGL